LRPREIRAANAVLSFGFSNDSWADQVDEEQQGAKVFRADSLSTVLVGPMTKPLVEPLETLVEPRELMLKPPELQLELEPREIGEVGSFSLTDTEALTRSMRLWKHGTLSPTRYERSSKARYTRRAER